MTILDLIKKSALMLKVDDITKDDTLKDVSYGDELTALQNNAELNRMFEMAKLVLDEVNNYSPNVLQYTGQTKDKKIDTNNFYNYAKIISVKDENGRYVKFSNSVRYVNLDKDGTYTITYVKSPDMDSMLNSIDYQKGKITEKLLVNGLNSYYCLANGLLPEFNVYNKLYLNQLSRLKNIKLFAMPCRSWNE